MVVDDVEDDGDPERMRAVDEAAEIVGPAVEPGRREQIDAVVAPAEPPGEFGHRHDFEAGDAELGESRQFARSRFPASLRGEGADMHLVDDELLARAAAPRPVGPSEVSGIDDFRRSVRPFRLKSRRRVGQCRFAPIETETIAHAGSRRQAPAVRSSRRSRIAAPPARGLRSRRQPRGSAAPRHGNGRRRRTAARRRSADAGQASFCARPDVPQPRAWAASRAAVSLLWLRPKPARASTSRPLSRPRGRSRAPAVARRCLP